MNQRKAFTPIIAELKDKPEQLEAQWEALTEDLKAKDKRHARKVWDEVVREQRGIRKYNEFNKSELPPFLRLPK